MCRGQEQVLSTKELAADKYKQQILFHQRPNLTGNNFPFELLQQTRPGNHIHITSEKTCDCHRFQLSERDVKRGVFKNIDCNIKCEGPSWLIMATMTRITIHL